MKYRIKDKRYEGRILTPAGDGRYTGYWTMDQAHRGKPWYWPSVGGRGLPRADESYAVFWDKTDLEPYFEVGDRVISEGHEGLLAGMVDMCRGRGTVTGTTWDGRITSIMFDDGRACTSPRDVIPDPTPAAVIKTATCPGARKKQKREPKPISPDQFLLDEDGKRFAVGAQVMFKTPRWGDQLATWRPSKRLDGKIRWCVFVGDGWMHYTDRDVIKAGWTWTIVFQP